MEVEHSNKIEQVTHSICVRRFFFVNNDLPSQDIKVDDLGWLYKLMILGGVVGSILNPNSYQKHAIRSQKRNTECSVCDKKFLTLAAIKRDDFRSADYCSCAEEFVDGETHQFCPCCELHKFNSKEGYCLNCEYVMPVSAIQAQRRLNKMEKEKAKK